MKTQDLPQNYIVSGHENTQDLPQNYIVSGHENTQDLPQNYIVKDSRFKKLYCPFKNKNILKTEKFNGTIHFVITYHIYLVFAFLFTLNGTLS